MLQTQVQRAPPVHKVHRGFQALHVIRVQRGQPVLLEQVPQGQRGLVAQVPQVDRVSPVPLVQMAAPVQPAIQAQQGVQEQQGHKDNLVILVHRVTQAQQGRSVLQVAQGLPVPQGKQV